jgi:hypothetical protein
VSDTICYLCLGSLIQGVDSFDQPARCISICFYLPSRAAFVAATDITIESGSVQIAVPLSMSRRCMVTLSLL